MSYEDCTSSPVRRARLAGGLIIAAAVFIPVMGAFQPAHAATVPSVPATGITHAISLPATGPKASTGSPDSVTDARVGQAAVAIAKAQTGKPYVWGAAGPDAFDCSGLVQWAYRKAGIKLPRVTYAQYRHVKHKVAWSQLAVGDLVFFNDKSHVGIISKRKGHKLWMIDAPHTGSYVQQVKLDSYRRQTFAGAVRPF